MVRADDTSTRRLMLTFVQTAESSSSAEIVMPNEAEIDMGRLGVAVLIAGSGPRAAC